MTTRPSTSIGEIVDKSQVNSYKKSKFHDIRHYGLMWPLFPPQNHIDVEVEIHESAVLAKKLGVKQVYICHEGSMANPSGSMKDYLVRQGTVLAKEQGARGVHCSSSGNHGLSAAIFGQEADLKGIVFVPDSASSIKLDLLCSFPNLFVVAFRDVIVDDVFRFAYSLEIPSFYNVNASNDELITGLYPIGRAVSKLAVEPTHVVVGVGNGTYLAGIGYALEQHQINSKIVGVGMRGAFPMETALAKNQLIYEQETFLTDLSIIDRAESAIPLESYSMPALIHILKRSNGFTLNDLVNADLAAAYHLLYEDKNLIKQGVIPEPTGILGLAAGLKYRESFTPDDVLLFSFTASGIKDKHGICALVPDIGPTLVQQCEMARPDLDVKNRKPAHTPFVIDKPASPRDLLALLTEHYNG
ncbi:MAG: PLP-dependent lyase/thiolase [Chloroflexota bacterium]